MCLCMCIYVYMCIYIHIRRSCLCMYKWCQRVKECRKHSVEEPERRPGVKECRHRSVEEPEKSQGVRASRSAHPYDVQLRCKILFGRWVGCVNPYISGLSCVNSRLVDVLPIIVRHIAVCVTSWGNIACMRVAKMCSMQRCLCDRRLID